MSFFIRRSGLFSRRITDSYVHRRQSKPFGIRVSSRGWTEMGIFLCQVWNKKIHYYDPKVKRTQMANLHSGVVSTEKWILMAQFIILYVERKMTHYWYLVGRKCTGNASGESLNDSKGSSKNEAYRDTCIYPELFQ